MTASNGEPRPHVSVIISSYNYERYLGETIASALDQNDMATEVIVVDDGSQDGSRDLIASYGENVKALFKENGGQASALNAGFELSNGEAVIFLDSDDMLLPGAVAAVAHALEDGALAKVHWSMPIIDQHGRRTGELQDPVLAVGDLRDHVRDDGPLSDLTMPSPPQSGNAFARWFLERVMPVPLEPYRISPDEYLFGLAPAFGPIARIEPQSLYRMHGSNQHVRRCFEDMLSFQERHHATVAQATRHALRSKGLAYDERAWAKSAWWPRTGRVVRAIEKAVPAGERLALIDEGELGFEAQLRGRHVHPFPELDGAFAGSPASDEDALAELERLLAARVSYLALAWPAFWWLEEYPRLSAALRAGRNVLVEDGDVVIFGPDGR